MFWYIVLMGLILFVVMICAIGKNHGYKTIDDEFVWLCSFPLLVFMALRASNVGIDTNEYVRAYSQIKNYSLSQSLLLPVYGRGYYQLSLEPLYRLMNWCTGLLSKNDQAIIVSGSILIIILLTNICKKYSAAPVLSLFMYLTLGIYQTHMNVSRNAMALFICYAGITFIKKRQILKYIVCILIGCGFHVSVVILLPLYWLVNNVSFDNKKFIRVLFGVIAFVFVFPFVKDYIVRIVPIAYRGYFIRSTVDLSGTLVGILYLALFIICILAIKKGTRYNTIVEERIGTWMLLLNTLFFALSLSMGNAARVAALFGPYIIIYIPNLLERAKHKNTMTVIIILLCISVYIARMLINNIGKTIPYQFFFSNQ